MTLNNDVNFILETLNTNNFEAFIVGGCVRDIILKIIPQDFDITTSATPEEIKKLFKKTFDTGIQHGTVTVVLNKTNYEVTTYRIDGEYKDNRRPFEVIFTKNLEEDLLRRDFTMNAIAYHNNTGFIDPYNGIKDIENKLIRGVGEPNKRFQEDALRILRAIRFSSQLGFKIEKNTYLAILDNNYLLKNISIERIRAELLKIIFSKNFEKLNLLITTDSIKYFSIELNDYLLKHLNNIINDLNYSTNDEIIKLGIFFQFFKNEKDLLNILKFLRLDNKTIDLIKFLVLNSNLEIENSKYSIRKLVNNFGKENIWNLIVFQKILHKNNLLTKNNLNNIEITFKILENNKEFLFIKDLKINGKDLINLNVNEGQDIGNILNYLLDHILQNPENNNKIYLTNLVKDKLNN